jgi:hypothetical protein
LFCQQVRVRPSFDDRAILQHNDRVAGFHGAQALLKRKEGGREGGREGRENKIRNNAQNMCASLSSIPPSLYPSFPPSLRTRGITYAVLPSAARSNAACTGRNTFARSLAPSPPSSLPPSLRTCAMIKVVLPSAARSKAACTMDCEFWSRAELGSSSRSSCFEGGREGGREGGKDEG